MYDRHHLKFENLDNTNTKVPRRQENGTNDSSSWWVADADRWRPTSVMCGSSNGGNCWNFTAQRNSTGKLPSLYTTTCINDSSRYNEYNDQQHTLVLHCTDSTDTIHRLLANFRPAHVVQWSSHLGAMRSRAWRSQWPRIDSRLGPGASNY